MVWPSQRRHLNIIHESYVLTELQACRRVISTMLAGLHKFPLAVSQVQDEWMKYRVISELRWVTEVLWNSFLTQTFKKLKNKTQRSALASLPLHLVVSAGSAVSSGLQEERRLRRTRFYGLESDSWVRSESVLTVKVKSKASSSSLRLHRVKWTNWNESKERKVRIPLL